MANIVRNIPSVPHVSKRSRAQDAMERAQYSPAEALINTALKYSELMKNGRNLEGTVATPKETQQLLNAFVKLNETLLAYESPKAPIIELSKKDVRSTAIVGTTAIEAGLDVEAPLEAKDLSKAKKRSMDGKKVDTSSLLSKI